MGLMGASGLSARKIIDLIYPVGSIYISASGVSPQSLFGGSWEQIQGRFMLTSGNGYSLGATGGEATHTLTQSEIPNYTIPQTSLTGQMSGGDTRLGPTNSSVNGIVRNNGGSFGYTVARNAGSDNNGFGTITINASHSHSSGGGGRAHNNMPPYIVVNAWKRTA